MTDLLLARHGNTFDPGQPALRVGARTDLPLVAEGRAQAARLAEALAAEGLRPARIVAGPLARTRQFAAILADRLGGTIILDDRLRELDYGTWEGLTDAEITARHGRDALGAWERRLEWPAAAGWGEGEAAVLSRIGAFLDEAADAPSPTLAVTSNGILRLVRRLIEGSPTAGEGKVRTGALCRLRRTGGGWHIAAWDERLPATGSAPTGVPST
ncbi:histidine phosphatase family protein [Roseomonas sp. CCTCC AB2023176]|uniref:histidine phosphatase family protein n=1 Tax=Roseomonas sp. CCTCC AB2023176 TaxID=3342640 RepID=UPI0035DAE3B0